MLTTVNFPDSLFEKSAALAAARGATVEAFIVGAVAKEVDGDGGSCVPVMAKQSRPIWEVLVDNMKAVPPDDLAALPTDGASQIDHYIHGVPKRP